MASKEKNSWILIQEKKRDRSLRVLVDECLSCTLYDEVSFFSVNMIEMKQATCMFNLTNVGSNMCVKDNSDLFLNLMQSKEPIMAFMSLKGNYPHGGKSLGRMPA